MNEILKYFVCCKTEISCNKNKAKINEVKLDDLKETNKGTLTKEPDYNTDSTESPINFIENTRKKSDKVSKFMQRKNSNEEKIKNQKKASKLDKSLNFLDQTNPYDSSVNDNSTFINTKVNNSQLNNCLNHNNAIKNISNINNNNKKNSANDLFRNYEKEIFSNEKNTMDLKFANEIFGVDKNNNPENDNFIPVKTAQFVQIESNSLIKRGSKSISESLLNDDENINRIKNQIRTNLTFLSNIQRKQKKDTYEYDEDFIINDDNNKESMTKFKDNDYQIISDNEGIENKYTEEEKFTEILMKQESDLLNEYENNKTKNFDSKKKKVLERKNTDNIASSFNLRNKVLPNLHISNMVSKEKTSIKKDFKIDKLKLLRSNTNKFMNNNSNSNSKHNSVNEENFSIKSFKFVKQRTISQNHLKPDKFGYQKQNSHFSYKSSSSNRNSVFTFQNHAQVKDKESFEIGNSILESIPEFSKLQSGYYRNIFFNNSITPINNGNFVASGQLDDVNKSAFRISLENINGDFFTSDKIVIDPYGLNVLNSINKDGSFYFGSKLKASNKQINDYLINPNKDVQSASCFKIFFDTRSYLISMEISYENNCKKDNEKESFKSKNTFKGKIRESKTTVSEKEYTFSPFEAPVTIGRAKCNINLTDSFLSKLHCRVEFTDNSWILLDGAEDKPSKNGTWLLIENEFTLEGLNIFKNGSSLFKISVSD